MPKLFLLLIACSIFYYVPAQTGTGTLTLTVVSEQQAPLSHVTVELLRAKDSSLLRTAITDTTGTAILSNLATGSYLCRISMVNYFTRYTAPVQATHESFLLRLPVIALQPSNSVLKEVTVSARKPFVQLMPDKTVVNVEAGITNAGATALEILEKSPGVTVDRDGNIGLKGKQNVLVLMDGKPTYLSGSDLAALLGGMSASQLDQIEIMDNPPAKYDAAGNAGVINIRTKKNRQKGFNGTLTSSYGQGIYWKTNNSLQLNYRTGKINLFMNYSMNGNQSFTDLYALRKYYKADNKTVTAMVEQPSTIFGKGYTNNLKAGIDYSVTKNTTLGMTLTGLDLWRKTHSYSNAQWKDVQGITDSIIESYSNSKGHWRSGGVNFNMRHSFNANRELTADIDYLGYNITNNQYFRNVSSAAGGYEEALQGDLPGSIRIFSAKADYAETLNKTTKLEAGWKSSHIRTDNIADYAVQDSTGWKADWNKTNHFKYTETIHAVYGQIQKQAGRFTLQGGLRYENTSYDANQLGNVMRKDSSFSRSYSSLFPTAYITYKADSINSFTISAGRRIDRPPFQKLNPFIFIINKYTYQQGNPYFRPQYTWNIQASHLFKDILITTLSYSLTKDYFSQIFLSDTASGIIIYTEGNLGRMENYGLSVSTQLSVASWWSLSAQANVNYKKITGVVWNTRNASLTQGNLNINNQFRFPKGWAGELSGFYNTSELELQETTDPSGQVAAGISKQVLKGKGTLRFTVRDIFYTQWMKGNTTFQQADEYFKLTRDTRVATLSFTWRFGKAAKNAARRSNGGAADEIQRVGNG